jgi:proteic killer suppression protein
LIGYHHTLAPSRLCLHLFLTGKTKDNRYNCYPKNVIEKYRNVIGFLKSASNIEKLFTYSSLNYKLLSGNKKDIHSVRVDRFYRIEFKVTKEDIITICNIKEKNISEFKSPYGVYSVGGYSSSIDM